MPNSKAGRLKPHGAGALCLVLLLPLAGGCASTGSRWDPGATRIPRQELSPEAMAAAGFLRGRSLELEGRLVDAAAAYEQAAQNDPASAELQRFLAHVYARMGNAAKAVESGQKALALEPDDEGTVLSMARLFSVLQRNGEAIALLEPSYDDGSLSVEGLFVLYGLYAEASELDASERVARAIGERVPEDVRGPLALGNVLERAGRDEEAEAAYRRGSAVDPQDPRVFDAIARLRRRAGNAKGELEILSEKLERHPDDVTALLRMAQIHEEGGDRDAAIGVLEGLIARHPDQLSAEFQLGFFLYEEKRHDEAVARFESVARAASSAGDPRFADEVHYFLGRAHLDQGNTAPAIEALERIHTDSERFADARILMARIHENDERFADAVVEVKRAVAAAPDNTAVQVYLAGLLQRDDDLEGAVELMENLIDTTPEDADLHYDLGLIYSSAGEDGRALEIMLEVLQRDGDHPSALNFVGYSWAEKGQRLDEAERMIARAVELRPDDGFIADSLGWVFYQKGLQQVELGNVKEASTSFQGAIRILEHALSLLDEADPVITRHLADAYRSVSRFNEALSTYRHALSLHPTTEDAVEIQRRIDLLELQVDQRSGARRH